MLAEYMAVPAKRPIAPTMLEMFTTAAPAPRLGNAARVTRPAPMTLTAHIASASSCGMTSARASRSTPAQLTTPVSLPIRDAAWTAASTLASERTSIG